MLMFSKYIKIENLIRQTLVVACSTRGPTVFGSTSKRTKLEKLTLWPSAAGWLAKPVTLTYAFHTVLYSLGTYCANIFLLVEDSDYKDIAAWIPDRCDTFKAFTSILRNILFSTFVSYVNV